MTLEEVTEEIQWIVDHNPTRGVSDKITEFLIDIGAEFTHADGTVLKTKVNPNRKAILALVNDGPAVGASRL